MCHLIGRRNIGVLRVLSEIYNDTKSTHLAAQCEAMDIWEEERKVITGGAFTPSAWQVAEERKSVRRFKGWLWDRCVAWKA